MRNKGRARHFEVPGTSFRAFRAFRVFRAISS